MPIKHIPDFRRIDGQRSADLVDHRPFSEHPERSMQPTDRKGKQSGFLPHGHGNRFNHFGHREILPVADHENLPGGMRMFGGGHNGIGQVAHIDHAASVMQTAQGKRNVCGYDLEKT